jgi:divalent metal cation (Fe/Co/Zn/Cd) transporter
MNTRALALPPGSEERAQAVRAGLRAEVLTMGWMLVEAVIAIGAGLVSRSVLLVAFGFDSVIELASAFVLFRRLSMEASARQLDRVEGAERMAAWTVAIALILLSIYIIVSSGYGLVAGSKPDESPAGIGLAVAALFVMPLLARTKRRIAWQLDSASLRGDAACSMTCAAMAGAMLIGLLLNAALHWWWAEYLASLSFLYWLVPEARAALHAASEGQTAHGGCHESCGH